ncbi:MAG: hypothetical protein OXC40_03820 [Proteobacteria bacterium]|nr:hypothetical protein [Pseudomonadota bacterium]
MLLNQMTVSEWAVGKTLWPQTRFTWELVDTGEYELGFDHRVPE